MYVLPNISIVSFEQVLENSYLNSLKLMKENNLRTIAFPCVSTGIYGFPHVSTFSNTALERLAPFSILIFLYVWFLLLKCLPEYLWSGVRVQRGSSHGQILLGEEQRFSGQGLEKRRRLFFFNCFQVVFCLYTREAEAVYKERVHIMFPVET